MKKLLIIFWLDIFCSWAHGQDIDWKLVNDLQIKDLELVSFDNRTQIFYTIRTGGLYQLSPDGVPLNHYSPQRQGSFTQLDAGRTVNIFTFSKDLQQFDIYDRFLNPLVHRNLDGMEIGLAQAATLGNNHSLWVFDESDLSLKRIDYRQQVILQHQPLGLLLEEKVWNVIDMKEYQNMLFLRIPEEVIVFDNQGNYLRRLIIPGESNLSLYDQFLYAIHDGKLIQHTISSGIKVEVELPFKDLGLQGMVHGDRLILYGKDQLIIFINPFLTKMKRIN